METYQSYAEIINELIKILIDIDRYHIYIKYPSNLTWKILIYLMLF